MQKALFMSEGTEGWQSLPKGSQTPANHTAICKTAGGTRLRVTTCHPGLCTNLPAIRVLNYLFCCLFKDMWPELDRVKNVLVPWE